MPLDFNLRENHPLPHDLYCDYCGDFISHADEGYATHFGFNTPRPKITPACLKCRLYEISLNFRRGCLVKGYGRVPVEILDKRDQSMETKVESKAGKVVDIHWGEVDKQIDAGTAKVSILAKQYAIDSGTMKELLKAKYGETLEFRRGRNGGIKRVIKQ